MKLIFTKPKGATTFCNNLLIAYWANCGIHYPENRVKVSYNGFHDFWDITIERGIVYKNGKGHGTPKQQQDLWDRQIEKLKQLHPEAQFMHGGWTWEYITDDTHLEQHETLSRSNTVVSCPTVRIWIKCEE